MQNKEENRKPLSRIRFENTGPKRPITLVALPPLRTDLLEESR